MTKLRTYIVASIMVALPVFAHAADIIAPPTDELPMSCKQAADSITSLPVGLLSSIGVVESGHIDEDGKTRAWTYTVDVDGNGYWFTNMADAIQFTQNAIAENDKSIDVGCFQVNLQAHPTAFSSLQEAFSPQANANYAAMYLSQLYNEYGNWSKAVGAYHSGNELIAAPYINAVMSVWNGNDRQHYISVNDIQRFTGQWVAMNMMTSAATIQVFYGHSGN